MKQTMKTTMKKTMKSTTKKMIGLMMIVCMLLMVSGLPVFAGATKMTSEEKKVLNIQIKQLKTTKIHPDKTQKGVRVSAAEGTYPTRKGVILATADAYKGLIPTGHAAIIYTKDKVIESLSKGVTTGKNNWNKVKKTCYAATPKKTTAAQDKEVADWCHKQISKKYNWNYLNVGTRKKFYCSHLVWAGFKDKQKIDLNTSLFGKAVHPLELVTNDKVNLIYAKN